MYEIISIQTLHLCNRRDLKDTNQAGKPKLNKIEDGRTELITLKPTPAVTGLETNKRIKK